MADSHLPDASYGGLLALASREHTAAGSAEALAEFHRLLRPKGVAVITVPYGGRLRNASRPLTAPLEAAKGSRLPRRIAEKPPPAKPCAPGIRRFALGPGGWSFYEDEFNRPQLEAFVEAAAFTDAGLLHTFARLALERRESDAARNLLRRLPPAAAIGHMLHHGEAVARLTAPAAA
jgi:hypothetical protein